MRLTMTAESHGVTDGDKAPSTARIKSFRVWGLPREQQALIYNLGDPLRDDWEVQRTENLNSEILSTGHPTAEAALKALQAKVDIEHLAAVRVRRPGLRNFRNVLIRRCGFQRGFVVGDDSTIVQA